MGKKEKLQRIVVNQSDEISKLRQKYEQNKSVMDKLRKKNEEMCKKHEKMGTMLKKTKKASQELMEKYALLKQVEDEKQRERENVVENGLDTRQTVELIVSFDRERFGKYFDILLTNMKREMVDGSCLPDLCKDDLYRFGIVHFKDRRDI